MNKLRNVLLLVATLAATSGCVATPTDPPQTRHPYSWLVGHWTGTGFGGTAEELWLPAAGNTMAGVFRLLENDKVSFYELITIEQRDNGAAMRLRHFHPDLTGWEKDDGILAWPAESLGDHSVRFGPVDYTLTEAGTLEVVVRVEADAPPITLTLRRN